MSAPITDLLIEVDKYISILIMPLQNADFDFRRRSLLDIFKSIDGAIAVKCLSEIVLPSELQNLESPLDLDVHIRISQQFAPFHNVRMLRYDLIIINGDYHGSFLIGVVENVTFL